MVCMALNYVAAHLKIYSEVADVFPSIYHQAKAKLVERAQIIVELERRMRPWIRAKYYKGTPEDKTMLNVRFLTLT